MIFPKIPRRWLYLLAVMLLPAFYFLFQILDGWEEFVTGIVTTFDLHSILFQDPRAHLLSGLLRTAILLAVILWGRRAFDVAQKNQERLTRILETAADGIYFVNRSGHMTMVNAAVERMLGATREEICKTTYNHPTWKITTLEGKPFPDEEQPFRRVIKTGAPVHGVEQCIQRADGKQMLVSINATPLHSGFGQVIGVVGTLTDITERKRAEELHLQLAAIVESSQEAIFSWTLDGTITSWNKGAEMIYGFRADEVLGKSIAITYVSETLRELDQILERLRRHERIEHFETQRVRKDGTRIDVDMAVSPLTDENGALVGGSVIGRDITARKRTEQELETTTSLLKSLFDNLDEFFFSVDVASGRVLQASNACEKMFGVSPQTFLDDPNLWKRFIHFDDQSKIADAGSQVSQGVTTTQEMRMVDSSGQTHWVEAKLKPVMGSANRPVRFDAILSDITARKRTQDQLRDSEERYRNIVENANDIIYQTDANGRFVFYNATASRLLNYSADELIGRHYLDIIDPSIRKETRRFYIDQVVRKIPSSYHEVAVIGKDGTTYWIGQNVQLLTEQGRVVGFQSVARDITEQKRAEEQIRILGKKDEQALSIAGMGRWEFDVATSQFTFNDQYYTLHGTTAEEAGGYLMSAEKFASQYVHPDDSQMIGDTIQIAIQSNDPSLQIQKEARILRADGEVRNVKVWLQIVKDPQGRTTKILGVNQDITERKHMEEQFRESEKNYRLLFQNSGEGILFARPDGIIESANPEACRIFGMSEDEIGKLGRFGVVDKNDSRLQAVFEARRRTKSFKGELNLLRKEGTIFPGEVSVTDFKDAQGKERTSIFLRDITDRKRAEAALADERNLLRSVIDFLPYEVFMKDRECRYTAINRMQASVLGIANPADAIGKTAIDFFPTEQGARYHQDDLRIMETGQPLLDEERKRQGANGVDHWRLISKVPLRNTNGQIIGIVGIGRDITERKQAEAEITRRNRELSALNKIGQALNYRVSPSEMLDLIYTTVNSLLDNRNFFIALHDEANQQISFPVYTIDGERSAPSSRPLRNGITEYVLRTKKPLWIPSHMDTKIKELGLDRIGRPALCFLAVPLLVGDKAIGVIALQDYEKEYAYSERDAELLSTFAAQAAIAIDNARLLDTVRESETKYRNIFENAVVGMYQSSMGGKWLTVNSAQARMLGYESPTQLIDEMSDLNHQFYVDANRRVEFIKQMEERDVVWGFESEVYRRDGSILWISENARTILGANGERNGYEGTTIDITDRKQVDRLKSEFVSVVSHELRTPLTSIRGSLGLIAGGVAGEVAPKAKSLIDIAYKNSERLVLLINDILDIEKIESGKMSFDLQPFELMPLLEQAVDANTGFGEQYGVKIVLKHALPGVVVTGDAGRVTQVVTNLISNAVKFSPRGNVVELAVMRRKSFVRVSVMDHGAGIPENFQSRIFQKFAQADSSTTRQRGGTGLGLSISKAIIEKLGGRIGFETLPGAGTTFFFDLPEHRVETKPPVPNARVLVCEDDHDTAALLQLLLEQAGYASDIAYDAAQAKAMVRQNHYAAMTLDLVLPDQNGIELMRDLREQSETRELPVIVVSVQAEQGRIALNGDAVHVIDWLSKPINPQRLLGAVRCAMSHGSRPAHILHIEDDVDILQIASLMLQNVAQVDRATSLREARRLLTQEHYDLVILDLEMPDGSGLDIVPLLQEQTPPIPVVIFSVEEISQETAAQVSAVLVKSRTSNEKLVETIQSLVQARLTIPA